MEIIMECQDCWNNKSSVYQITRYHQRNCFARCIDKILISWRSVEVSNYRTLEQQLLLTEELWPRVESEIFWTLCDSLGKSFALAWKYEELLDCCRETFNSRAEKIFITLHLADFRMQILSFCFAWYWYWSTSKTLCIFSKVNPVSL